MLSAVWQRPADATGCASCRCIGHADARAPTAAGRAARRLRAADPLGLLGPPLRARAAARLRPAVRRRRPARPARAAPLALRDDDAARRRAARRRRQLRRRDRAGAAGRHRVHPARPTTATSSSTSTHAGRHEPGARQRQGAPGRGGRAQHSRGRGWSSTTDRRHRQRLSQLGAPGHAASSSSSRSERKRTQKRGRGGDPQGARADPRHRGRRSATGRSTWRCSAPTRRCWTPRSPSCAEQVTKVPGIADLSTSVKPGLPAYAVRLSPTRCASSA